MASGQLPRSAPACRVPLDAFEGWLFRLALSVIAGALLFGALVWGENWMRPPTGTSDEDHWKAIILPQQALQTLRMQQREAEGLPYCGAMKGHPCY